MSNIIKDFELNMIINYENYNKPIISDVIINDYCLLLTKKTYNKPFISDVIINDYYKLLTKKSYNFTKDDIFTIIFMYDYLFSIDDLIDKFIRNNEEKIKSLLSIEMIIDITNNINKIYGNIDIIYNSLNNPKKYIYILIRHLLVYMSNLYINIHNNYIEKNKKIKLVKELLPSNLQ